MEGERPKISVIVPVYNVEAYVERCLASLAAQTYPHVEVVMVDDASTDGGGRICDAWAAREEGFHVVHLQENQGVSAARNEGSHRASGAYIAFVDSDDYVEPNLLEKLYQALTGREMSASAETWAWACEPVPPGYSLQRRRPGAWPGAPPSSGPLGASSSRRSL